MSEIVPVNMDKQEIFFKEEKPFTIAKARKRKGKKSRLGAKIFAFLFIGVCVFYIATNFTNIKEYFTNLLPKNNVAINSSNSNTTNDNLSNDESDKDNIKHNFIDTCPDKFYFINETDTELVLDDSYNFSRAKELYEKYSYDSPIVLIVNFSPKEAFNCSNNYYSEDKNVCNLGKEICDKLNQNGINALHLYDSSSSTLLESRDTYEQKINDTLKMYPSISYIFDISRALYFENDSILNEYVLLNEGKLPTIQLLCGTSNGNFTSYQKKSCAFAYELTKIINVNDIPLISRLITTKYDLSQSFPCTVLRVDIGSFANKYDDALKTAQIFANGVIDFLNAQ